MTREELLEVRARINDAPFSVMREWLLKSCNALEAAWRRIDKVEERNLNLTIERDEALKEGLALTVEKDGLQLLINDLRQEVKIREAETEAADEKVRQLKAEVKELQSTVRDDKRLIEFGGCE